MPEHHDSTGAPGSESLRAEARSILRDLIGNDAADFRDGQFEAIEALVAQHQRVLVVQRTGWGKSAVYFVAARILRQRGAGPTVIISPLLSLMRDQVAAASRAGVRAATINSSNVTEWQEVVAQLNSNELDVLLISPERLNNPRFRTEVLGQLLSSLGMIVVDEAHCISDWGHDFRPDYRRIGTLLSELPAELPVLATTATANERVVDDVATQLGQSTHVIRGGLARDSLRLGVMPTQPMARRIAWLQQHLGELTGSGIIYVLTVSAAEDVARAISEAGWQVAAYTGRTDAEDREVLERRLKDNDVKALVATSALGMGFDKPDLGFVIHLGAPSSAVAYYQQVGRAGRATEHADVLLMPGAEDPDIWEYFATASMPDEEEANAVLGALRDSQGPLSIPAIEPMVGIKRSRLTLLMKTLQVDGAVEQVQGGFIATSRPWTYDAQRYAAVAEARQREAQGMLDYERTSTCRMRWLAEALDDPGARDCGRCDNCTAPWWDADVDDAATEKIRGELGRIGQPIDPRAQWPTGLPKVGLDLKGKIPGEERSEEGRFIARFTDLGMGQQLREFLKPGGEDGPVTRSLAQACITVLSEWNWVERPEVVVSMPSDDRPQSLRSLAEGLATVGRLTDAGALSYISDPGPRDVNSAYRVRNLAASLHVPDHVADAVRGKVVLLVDLDFSSRWGFAWAARLLRLAGARAVLPFALAQRG